MKRTIAVIMCIIIVLPLFCGCSGAKNAEGKLSVVATLFPQYDFARAILGDKGEATLLLTPGGNSHSFELTASDISKINSCDVFVYTGPNMEIWVDGIMGSINKDVTVLDLSKNVQLRCATDSNNHNDGGHKHTLDPHIWTSPVIAMNMLTEIYNAICRTDPDNEEYYKKNYENYLYQLKDLNTEFKNISQSAEQKTLYFSGKFAFLYFVNEYDLNYVAPFNSCSDMQVEDLASVANLISEMKNNNVKYIFYEEFATTDLYSTITKETGATALLLHSAHNVSKSDFDKGVTYIDIMTQNAANLKRALLNG